MSAAKLFELVCAGYILASVSAKVRRARWEGNVDLNPHTSPPKIAEDAGYRLAHHGAHLWIEGLACPECGTKSITKTGTPSCKIISGVYGSGCDASNSTRVVCEACRRWRARSSDLVRLLHPSPTQRLAYLEQNCRGAEPQMQRFTATRFAGSVSLRAQTVDAIQTALPVEHDGEIECCLIEAIDEGQALEVLQLIPEAAWVIVPVTTEGEPRVLAWHQQKPTVTEVAAYERVKAREDKSTRASIELEVRAFREQRLHDAGLRAG